MVEVQDIFRLHEQAYKLSFNPSYIQCKAISSIVKCRTAALGSHIDTCGGCGNVRISYNSCRNRHCPKCQTLAKERWIDGQKHNLLNVGYFHAVFTVRISYNSCRNRHCPKCQTLAKERWIDGQKHNLLNVGYFHAVFTVPDNLRPIFYQNQKEMYNLLFKAVSETLHELAANKKYLGAKIGFTSILHTWGQNLMFHPHIHCIIPAGGLDSLGKWVDSRKKFFIPVKVLSRKFRGKFLDYLKSAKLEFYGEQQFLNNPDCFQNLLNTCYNKDWVVYCKSPFKTAASVVEYLGRYTHRVAISNNRIIKMENGYVSFKWRDYKDGNKWKTMTVSAVEFIRRFLTHILPSRFVKIRHYGFLSNNNHAKILLCKRLTNTPIIPKVKTPALELICKLLGRDVSVCSVCGFKNDSARCLSPPLAA